MNSLIGGVSSPLLGEPLLLLKKNVDLSFLAAIAAAESIVVEFNCFLAHFLGLDLCDAVVVVTSG